MTISVFFLGLGIAGVLFAGLLAGCFVQRHLSTKRIGDANDLARRIIEEARKEAQAQKKEILVQGQDEQGAGARTEGAGKEAAGHE